MKLIRQITLYFKKGNSDKVYEIDLCESGENKFVVNFRYGKRGSVLKDGSKTILPVDREKAESIYNELMESKLKKGYSKSLDDFADEGQPAPSMSADPNLEAPRSSNPKHQAILNYIAFFLQKLKDNTYTEYIKPTKDKGSKATPKKKWSIERAVWRAGELKIKEAEPLLLECIGRGSEMLDYCAVWSLGFCTVDKQSVIKKLLDVYDKPQSSEKVKRITTEALLKIFDDKQREDFRSNLMEAIPSELRQTMETSPKDFPNEVKQYMKLADYKQADILYALYLIDTPLTRKAVIETIKTAKMRPNYFKQIRHIFKASEYRRDGEIFGLIAYRFSKSRAMFNSDAYYPFLLQRDFTPYNEIKHVMEEPDSKYAYSSDTRYYFRRRVCRTLRKLGEANDPDYVKMASGVLVPFTDEDGGQPRKSFYTRWFRVQRDGRSRYDTQRYTTQYDSFAQFIAFNYILYRKSFRYHLIGKTWRCKEGYKPGDPEPVLREEAFPELWDKQYRKAVELLSKSGCERVHRFGVKILRDQKLFMDNLLIEDVKTLLSTKYEVSCKLGFELAMKLYDAHNLDKELIGCMLNSAYLPAREQAMRWIKQKKNEYVNDVNFVFSAITSEYSDIRTFIMNILTTSHIDNDRAKQLFSRLVSYVIMWESNKRKSDYHSKKLEDISNLLLRVFPKHCGELGLDVIVDLISHPLRQVQELGANIILKHNKYATQPTNEILQSLIKSNFLTVRQLGVGLFGQLPDELLLEREETFIDFITHKEPELRTSIRPSLKRLVNSNPEFGNRVASLLIDKLFRIKNEETQQFIVNVIREDFRHLANLPLEKIFKLIRAKDTAIQELGGHFLQRSDELSKLSVQDILTLADRDALLVREVAWSLCKDNVELMKRGIDYTIRLLDAKWDDTRDFAFDFIRNNFTEYDFTPQALVSICDSVREDVQMFGKELITTYFEDKDGEKYLLKLSEHPSTTLQLFVTNYLERYAENDPEKLKRLSHYFKSALCRVNKGRVAKERIMAFLEKEALKSREASEVIGEILKFVSATISVTYKARATKIMVNIYKKYPDIALPIRVKDVEERNAI
jgi:predicted DNA-binding WGR domain protein